MEAKQCETASNACGKAQDHILHLRFLFCGARLLNRLKIQVECTSSDLAVMDYEDEYHRLRQANLEQKKELRRLQEDLTKYVAFDCTILSCPFSADSTASKQTLIALAPPRPQSHGAISMD